MANVASNKIKYLLATKQIDFANDSFKIILMATGFVFNKDTHHKYADVLASELATAYGYTRGTKALSGVAVTEDDTLDECTVIWSNVTWTASGGAIGPSPGAIIYDDSETDDSIVGYLDFGGDYTQADGGVLTLSGIEVDLV
jgi:hypothetical protein